MGQNTAEEEEQDTARPREGQCTAAGPEEQDSWPVACCLVTKLRICVLFGRLTRQLEVDGQRTLTLLAQSLTRRILQLLESGSH